MQSHLPDITLRMLLANTECIKKLNRFEIALNFAEQVVISRFCYI